MEGIHYIHPRDYDPDDDRFFRTAFANNRGSLSFDDADCIESSDLTICEHIAKYFPQPKFAAVVREPPVFWRFKTENLPVTGTIKKSAGRNPCHYVVEGLDDAELWPVFEETTLSDLQTCEDGAVRATKKEDLILNS